MTFKSCSLNKSENCFKQTVLQFAYDTLSIERIFDTLFFINKVGMQVSGRASDLHLEGLGFNPRHLQQYTVLGNNFCFAYILSHSWVFHESNVKKVKHFPLAVLILKLAEKKQGTLGVEPRTCRIAAGCSTTELYPHIAFEQKKYF